MSGAAYFGVKKLKGGGIITVAARHNKREIQAELGSAGSMDKARTHLNYAIVGPATADDVGDMAKERMAAAGVGKLRKDAVQALEFVFSLPADTSIDGRAYFTACTEWADATFGGVILSAEVHHDEGAPHCHVLLLPLVDGRMDGSNLIGGKQNLARLHKEFHAAVASAYGLHKAPARLFGTAKQAGGKAVLHRLRTTDDSALQSRAWDAIRKAVERDPAPFLLALGIKLNAPEKRVRPMAQIFTSKGKGPANESPIQMVEESSNPTEFAIPEKTRTLCSVGFTPNPGFPAQISPPTAASAVVQTRQCALMPGTALPEQERLMVNTRELDRDVDLPRYSPAIGDYFPTLSPPRRIDEADA